MGIEKMGSLEGRAIRNGRAIDMQWLRENEVNEMRTSHDVDETKGSSDYIDPESYKYELEELREILKNMDKEDEKEDTNVLDSSYNLDE